MYEVYGLGDMLVRYYIGGLVEVLEKGELIAKLDKGYMDEEKFKEWATQYTMGKLIN